MRIFTLVAMAAFATAAHALEYLKLEQLGGWTNPSLRSRQVLQHTGVVDMPDGSVAILDRYRRCVYLVKDGILSLLAGREDFSGEHLGRGDEAKFSDPTALILDRPSGDLLLMDAGARKLLRISREGSVALVRVFPDSGHMPFSLDEAADGAIYSLCPSGRVYRYRLDSDALDYVDTEVKTDWETDPLGSGGVAALNSGVLIAFRAGFDAGTLQKNAFTQFFQPRWSEREVDVVPVPDFQPYVETGSGWRLSGMTRDSQGDLYTLSINGAGDFKVDRFRTESDFDTVAEGPRDLAVEIDVEANFFRSQGTLLVSPLFSSDLYRVVNGGFELTELQRHNPKAIPDDVLEGSVLRICVSDQGAVHFVPAYQRSISTWSADTGLATRLASFGAINPEDLFEEYSHGIVYRLEMAADADDKLYFSDSNSTVVRVSYANGTSEVFAGAPFEAGQVDGPRLSMRFTRISSMSMAPDGSLYLADAGNLRVISSAGVGRTLIQRKIHSPDDTIMNYVSGDIQRVTVSPDGTVYVADGYSVRKLTADMQLETVAGVPSERGTGSGVREAARFNLIRSLAADRRGNVFVADEGGIRVIKPTGEVSRPVFAFVGHDGSALMQMGFPFDFISVTLAVGPHDELYVGGPGIFKATLADTANDPIRIINFSARGQAMDDEANLILGFGTSGPGAVLLGRGIGPSLAQFGINDSLASTGVVFLEADGLDNKANLQWRGDPFLEDLSSRCGAFALAEDSLEGVALTKVATGNGFLTLREPASAGGTALLELYDVNRSTDAELSNCSVRGFAGDTANALAAGLVLEGKGVKKILIRAAGPALTDFHLAHVLQKPKIRVFRNRQLLAEKAGWENDSAVSDATARVGAFAFRTGSHDSALVLDLPAGDYTAEVESADGSGGVVLLELYEIP